MADNSISLPFGETLGRLTGQQKLGLIVGLAALVALVTGLWLWGTTPDYRVLYSNLSDRDGGAIVDSLQQMNVPYKFAEGGGALLVPANQVHEVRLRLASQGLPKGGTVGFELMENQKFGTSEFLEQVNYARALEGELARSVQTISAVQAARVHLALPKPSVFLKDQDMPSASVLLVLYPGRTLDAGQVNAIVHLISSSVPNMPPRNVTVVDQNGNLLSSPPDSSSLALDASQLKYVHQVEQDLDRRVEAIVAPLVGEKNVHAQVTAVVDFSQQEQTSESYKPNQPPNQAAVLSQQTSESASVNAPSVGGVPGALTNQPPVPPTAPITAPGQTAPAAAPVGQQQRPGQPGANNAAPAPPAPAPVPTSTSSHKETTINYDVDHTVNHTQFPAGILRRISVAVVLNNRTIKDAAGKVSTRPMTDAEKTQITALIKDAVGFDEKRGDTIDLLNSAFDQNREALPETPWWKQPDNLDMARDGIKYLVIAGLGLFLILAVIRPALKNLAMAISTPRSGASAAGAVPGAGEAGLQQGIQVGGGLETQVGQARQLVQQDPRVVASVVKEWVSGNE